MISKVNKVMTSTLLNLLLTFHASPRQSKWGSTVSGFGSSLTASLARLRSCPLSTGTAGLSLIFFLQTLRTNISCVKKCLDRSPIRSDCTNAMHDWLSSCNYVESHCSFLGRRAICGATELLAMLHLIRYTPISSKRGLRCSTALPGYCSAAHGKHESRRWLPGLVVPWPVCVGVAHQHRSRFTRRYPTTCFAAVRSVFVGWETFRARIEVATAVRSCIHRDVQ